MYALSMHFVLFFNQLANLVYLYIYIKGKVSKSHDKNC